jgi:hypothetical protein
MSQQQFFNQERLGRSRLKDDKPARAQLQADANALLTSLQALIPSNYPNTPNSNLGIAYRTLSREYARISESINLINDDKEFSATRIEFIQQILAERLFQNGQVVTPSNYNDQSYRKFLLAIKNAYLIGSKKDNIEALVSNLTGLEINLRELFLEAREQNSAYNLTDTHSMIMEIFIDDLASGTSITTIVNQINFLVNLIKPAHTLYDSKLIWTDQYDTNKVHDILFGDLGGGCIPIYLYNTIANTVLGTKIIVVAPVTGYIITSGTSGVHLIESIDLVNSLVYLDNGTKIVVDPGYFTTTSTTTLTISIDIDTDRHSLTVGKNLALSVGQAIILTHDSSHLMQGTITSYNPSTGALVAKVSYAIGSGTYSHWVVSLSGNVGDNGTTILGIDGRGIYLSDLSVGQYIQLECLDIPGEFEFYSTPPDLVDATNTNIQFYPSVFRKPAFQEFVKKAMMTQGDSSGRFPLQVRSSTTTLCDRWVQDTYQPYYEDLRRNCSQSSDSSHTYSIVLKPHMWFPRFAWPSMYGTGREITGDIYGFSMPYVNITDSTNQITVVTDSTQVYGAVTAVDATAGYISLQNDASYWDASGRPGVPQIGQEIAFGYHYTTDGINSYDTTTTVVFGISQWELPGAPIANSDGSSILALPSDVQVRVDGTYIPDAVLALNSIGGFVTLQDTTTFWDNSPIHRIPATDDTISFHYYGSGIQTYSMLFDDIARDFDSKVVFDSAISGIATSITLLTINTGTQSLVVETGLVLFAGQAVTIAYDSAHKMQGTITSYNPINGVLIVNINSVTGSGTYSNWGVSFVSDMRMPIPANDPAQIGYKWRANLLHHASVLNSPDTLVLNGYQKPAERASISNRQDSLNHFNYFFSPEHLYDTDPNIVLDDNYLNKDNEPLLVLNEGVPTFQKTFAYQPNLIEERNLLWLRSHLDSTDSTNSLLMYSDLLLKETKSGDSDVHISTICDNASVGFKLGYKEALNKLQENSEWILFDVAQTDGTSIVVETDGTSISIPGSRVFDWVDVFPDVYTESLYYDGYETSPSIYCNEYINYMNDYSDGIKHVYYNISTNQLEDHVYSGPVFETYDATEDEISSHESFPNALVRIKNPLSTGNPLDILNNYDFLNEPAIRIRKKTVRELMPEGQYRITEFHEALPV